MATLPENPVYEAPQYDVKRVEYLGQYIKAMNASNGDLTDAYTEAIAQLTDEDYETTLSSGTYDVFYVIQLPEAIRKFQSLKVYYKGGNDYSTSVLFYTAEDLDVAADTYGNYVPSTGGLWMHTAFSGAAENDAEGSVVTFTNTNNEAINYIALRGDNSGNPLSATEVELYYFDDGNFDDKPGEGQVSKETARVIYLKDYMTAVNADNGDETANFADQIAALTDGDTAAGTSGIYYIINLPEGLKDFQSLKVFYNGGNDYSTNVFFYTAEDLDVAADTYGNYVPSGGNLWQHTGFSGAVEVNADEHSVTFKNTTKEKFNFVALRGDNGANPLSATEVELYYYLGGSFEEAQRLDPVNYWTLTDSWTSTRPGGSVAVNADGSMTANAGTDNAKRADIKNATESFYLADHKVVFYVAEPTAAASGVTQNFGDMKFGYTATIADFSETAVVNEQLLRGNSSNTQYPVDGGYLVYFDLGGRNANVAYYSGDSGNKFDGTTKDNFRAALNAVNDLTISVPNFTLIGSDNTAFTITKMGSAKDVETLINVVVNGADGIRDIERTTSVAAHEVYDLQGRRIEHAESTVSKLPRGLYIINGRKVVIK